MTMTRPCRRMIRHLLQIFFTLGLTFIAVSSWAGHVARLFRASSLPGRGACRGGPRRLPAAALLVPVDDPAPAQVVGAQLHDHPVIRQDADVVHAHLPADVSQYLVPVVQLHTEEGIR